MRVRRYLLLTTALSATAGSACRKDAASEPPPGNPKGSVYDAGARPPLPTTTPPTASTPRVIPPPGNPKGSVYDGNTQGGRPLGARDAGEGEARPQADPKGGRASPDPPRPPPPSPTSNPLPPSYDGRNAVEPPPSKGR